MEQMTDEELGKAAAETSVFSRVVPEHKMRIIKALQKNGETVAMTGDGVNDAPALKYADIGIAMGLRGSEVSREAADLILLDDNFTTIVETVKDGRRIYDNIRRAVGYIFTIHLPIILASLLPPLFGTPPSAPDAASRAYRAIRADYRSDLFHCPGTAAGGAGYHEKKTGRIERPPFNAADSG